MRSGFWRTWVCLRNEEGETACWLDGEKVFSPYAEVIDISGKYREADKGTFVVKSKQLALPATPALSLRTNFLRSCRVASEEWRQPKQAAAYVAQRI